MREGLVDVYWIGGGSGAGKSTIAKRLAARYGLVHYATDDVMGDHARRSDPADAPFLADFLGMDMDERWLHRSPEAMLETFHWFRGEGFALIVEDLVRLPRERGVVVDGFRLLPELVRPLLGELGRAVWLLPRPEFRLAAFDGRGSRWAIAGQTSEPERALANLLARDAMFTERLRAQTRRLGLSAVDVDGSMTEDELERRVAGLFDLPVSRPAGADGD